MSTKQSIGQPTDQSNPNRLTYSHQLKITNSNSNQFNNQFKSSPTLPGPWKLPPSPLRAPYFTEPRASNGACRFVLTQQMSWRSLAINHG